MCSSEGPWVDTSLQKESGPPQILLYEEMDVNVCVSGRFCRSPANV